MSSEPENPEVGADGPAPASADPEATPTDAPTPAEKAEKRPLHEVVHLWIPLAIVVVSVCAAIVGWRASLSDESATRHEELSRQDLVQQQQLLIQDNDAVDSDIQTFGQFAEDSLLAESLLHDANTVGGNLAGQLRIEGGADLTIALGLAKEIHNISYVFDPTNPQGNPDLRSDGSYLPGHPYSAATGLATAENNDFSLHGLEPGALLAVADNEHDKGVNFTGVAALFIAVLVLLTLGAVVPGRQKLWFAGSGAALGLTALALFLVAQFS